MVLQTKGKLIIKDKAAVTKGDNVVDFDIKLPF